jgi:hypothetical protein
MGTGDILGGGGQFPGAGWRTGRYERPCPTASAPASRACPLFLMAYALLPHPFLLPLHRTLWATLPFSRDWVNSRARPPLLIAKPLFKSLSP